MKARWFWCVAIAQVALLVFMAGEREWVLHTGRTVVVHAEPVDPTDPMRGAYVRLAHRLSEVPRRFAVTISPGGSPNGTMCGAIARASATGSCMRVCGSTTAALRNWSRSRRRGPSLGCSCAGVST